MKEKVLKNTPTVIALSPSILNSLSKNLLSDKTAMRSKKEAIVNCSDYPNWNHERLYLSWDFYPNPEKFESVIEITEFFLSQKRINYKI